MKTVTAVMAVIGLMPFATHAEFYPPVPCEEFRPDDFRDSIRGEIRIIDIGLVKKEAGNNVCSIVMDTTAGRFRMVFTGARSVNGLRMWEKIYAGPLPR